MSGLTDNNRLHEHDCNAYISLCNDPHISVVRGGMSYPHTPPPVHSQSLPGDEGGPGGGEEKNDGGHLSRVARPPQRMESLALLQVGRGLLLRHAAPPEDLGGDHSGVDGVDPDPGASNLQSHASGHLVQGSFGHLVSQSSRVGSQPRNAGDVDDTTRPGHQVGETLLAELHSRLEVDLHRLLNILHAHVLEVGSGENTGVVYQNIKP